MPSLVAALSLTAATAWAAGASSYTQADWESWKAARDHQLKNVMVSYLSVVDIAQIKSGESVYLPVNLPRAQISWRKDPPGKPMVTFNSRGDSVTVAVSATGENFDLLNTHPGWTTPDGMTVIGDAAGDGAVLTLRDPQATGFKDFKGFPYFPFDPKAVVHAHFHPVANPERSTVMTTKDRPRTVWFMGTLDFVYDGKNTSLKAYSLGAEPSAHELFVPFLDATNGIETYSGGRYVETDADSSGAATIDFNRAYNPYCARNRVFSCIRVSGKPIEARVLAGEKAPHGH